MGDLTLKSMEIRPILGIQPPEPRGFLIIQWMIFFWPLDGYKGFLFDDSEEPFVGTLDYIFVSKHPEVTGVERMPTLGEETGHLPNQYEPSDHLPVTAFLRPFGKAAIEPVGRPLAAPLRRPQSEGLSRRPLREETGSTVGRRFGSWNGKRLLRAE
eukprot:s133_g29.t1